MQETMKTARNLLIALLLAFAAYLLSQYIAGGLTNVLHVSAAAARHFVELLPSIVFIAALALLYFGIKRNNERKP
jgi:hypothetical protein